MNPITRPNNYILPILMCAVVTVASVFGLTKVNEKSDMWVGLLSGGACIGSIMTLIGIAFFVKSKGVLNEQTKRYVESQEYWRTTNPSRYSDNQNGETQNKRYVSKGNYSKPYRNSAKGSNSGKHIQNRNEDGTYNDSRANHYYDTWDYPEESLGSQLLEQVHDEYGTPSLNANLCTENFSGDIAYAVDLNGTEFKYVQEYSEGRLVDEHVEDKDGYSLENYED